jgi:hypothetical protein
MHYKKEKGILNIEKKKERKKKKEKKKKRMIELPFYKYPAMLEIHHQQETCPPTQQTRK